MQHKLKLFANYKIDNLHPVPAPGAGGRNQLISRNDSDSSKGSLWLIKSNECQPVQFRNILAALEAYAGALYQFFIPDNCAKTRLFYQRVQENSLVLVNYQVGSKFMKHFIDFSSCDKAALAALSLTEKNRLRREIIKTRIIACLLGEIDLDGNPRNFGFEVQEDKYLFKKIDHGYSLRLNNNSDGFSKSFKIKQSFVTSHIVDLSNILGNLQDETLQWQVIDEIINVNDHALLSLMLPFEKILTQLRDGRECNNYSLVGKHENTISSLVIQRLIGLRDINWLRKNIELEILERRIGMNTIEHGEFEKLLEDVKHIGEITPHTIKKLYARFNLLLLNFHPRQRL